MTNEEANLTIDYLKEMQEGYIEGEGYERHPLPEWYALDKAIEVLEWVKWIPVSERLPTKEEYIANNGLFIVSDGNRTCAEYFDVYNSMKYFGEPTMNGFRVDRCVTAWMPLPKAYEPQESEDEE